MQKWNKPVILITGGAGFFGRKLVEILLTEELPSKVIVFSRDEFKHHNMRKFFQSHARSSRLSFVLGDVRDYSALNNAMRDVDFVFHAAALKQVPLSETQPYEFVKTNILGTENVVRAATYNSVKKVLLISTDKAVDPINAYGATKFLSEKIIYSSNIYNSQTLFSVVRYGNVLNSTGSFIENWAASRKTTSEQNVFPITDAQMTRFWTTIDSAVQFSVQALNNMRGGETFIPKMVSSSVVELIRMLDKSISFQTIGSRGGEKLVEELLSAEESKDTYGYQDGFIVDRLGKWKEGDQYIGSTLYSVDEKFRYKSDKNDGGLTKDWLLAAIGYK